MSTWTDDYDMKTTFNKKQRNERVQLKCRVSQNTLSAVVRRSLSPITTIFLGIVDRRGPSSVPVIPSPFRCWAPSSLRGSTSPPPVPITVPVIVPVTIVPLGAATRTSGAVAVAAVRG